LYLEGRTRRTVVRDNRIVAVGKSGSDLK